MNPDFSKHTRNIFTVAITHLKHLSVQASLFDHTQGELVAQTAVKSASQEMGRGGGAAGRMGATGWVVGAVGRVGQSVR